MALTKLPDNLPALLRAAGLNVIEIDGWRTRSANGATPTFVGVLNHHTGASSAGWSMVKMMSYARWLFLTGRPDLPPPLCQIALAFIEGRPYVFIGAAGRANHGGDAKPVGSVAGGNANTLYVGIEWMLSGTEKIPADLYEAGVTLNAVLLDILGSSERAVACHYQTSVTGKWDIGDPEGIPFNGHKVLDVAKFRGLVKARRIENNEEKPLPGGTGRARLWLQHTAMQGSDSDEQHIEDAKKVFGTGADVVGGTEAGRGAGNLTVALRAAALKQGYVFWHPGGQGGWIAVRQDIVKSGTKVKRLYKQVLESSAKVGDDRKYGPRGIVGLAFEHVDPRVGKVSIGEVHLLTKGRTKGQTRPGPLNHYLLNTIYDRAIGAWAAIRSSGDRLTFVMGDMNLVDKDVDVFRGQPFITCWDELKQWPNTGHGNIDVIARWIADKRVKCLRARARAGLNLNTDHITIDAVYEIAPPR